MFAFKPHDESARLRDAVTTVRRASSRTTTTAAAGRLTDAPARCAAINEEKLK